MVKDRFLIVVIIFLFILNLFTLGYLMFERKPLPPEMNERDRFEQTENDPGKRDKNRPDRLIIDKLKLNEAQVKQFELLKKEHRMQIDLLQDSSRTYHDVYFGLLKNEAPDSNNANALLNKIAQNQIEIDKVTYIHFEKIKAICDPSQKELFNNFIDEIARSFKPPMPKK